MLVLSRQRDQSILMGSEQTVCIDLSAAEREALRRCVDPRLDDLAARLLEAEPGPITVTVVDIRGDKVRLGTTAPKQLSVHRTEVYDAIRRENRTAVAAPAPAAVT